MSNAKPRVLAFAGSTRSDSFNKKLIRIAAEGAREAGGDVRLIDLRDFPMPFYDGDLESRSGLPENALKLKALLAESDAFLIATPEYNSGYSAVLKNSIDWTSRPDREGEGSLSAYKGKTAALMAAAPGALGGLRGLYQLRELLMNMYVTVLPGMRAVGNAAAVFDQRGALLEAPLEQTITGLGQALVLHTEKMQS